jgi:hypothetical protein
MLDTEPRVDVAAVVRMAPAYAAAAPDPGKHLQPANRLGLPLRLR